MRKVPVLRSRRDLRGANGTCVDIQHLKDSFIQTNDLRPWKNGAGRPVVAHAKVIKKIIHAFALHRGKRATAKIQYQIIGSPMLQYGFKIISSCHEWLPLCFKNFTKVTK
jgi:hypothetical protein